MKCKCGAQVHDLALDNLCAVCRLLSNFCDATCEVFTGGDCTCGGVDAVDQLVEQWKGQL